MFYPAVENPREQAEDVDCFFLLTQKGAEAARRAMGGNRVCICHLEELFTICGREMHVPISLHIAVCKMQLG